MERFPDTGRSTGAYNIYFQCGPIDHGTYIPGPVYHSSTESEYNAACTAGMTLAHFRMSIHEFLNKDPDVVSEEATIIILDSKSAVCMDNNGKDTKHTRHIARRVSFVRKGENWKMHKIDWCDGGLQLRDIVTNNVCENDWTLRMKYIMIRLQNWDRTLVQEGWQNIRWYMDQKFCMTRLDWVHDSTQSVWNICRTLKTVCSRRKTTLFSMENNVGRKAFEYRK